MNTIDELKKYETDLNYVWWMQLACLLKTGRSLRKVRQTIKELEGE